MGFSSRKVRSVNQESDKSGHFVSSLHPKVICLLGLHLYNVFLSQEFFLSKWAIKASSVAPDQAKAIEALCVLVSSFEFVHLWLGLSLLVSFSHATCRRVVNFDRAPKIATSVLTQPLSETCLGLRGIIYFTHQKARQLLPFLSVSWKKALHIPSYLWVPYCILEHLVRPSYLLGWCQNSRLIEGFHLLFH